MKAMKRMTAMALLAVLCAASGPARSEEAPNCDEALSTHDMNTCADKDFETADAELNAVFKKALAAIPERAIGEAPFDAKSWEQALRASQRAWIAFRDLECEGHVGMFWAGGSGSWVDIAGCKTEKTEARTNELKTRYEIE